MSVTRAALIYSESDIFTVRQKPVGLGFILPQIEQTVDAKILLNRLACRVLAVS